MNAKTLRTVLNHALGWGVVVGFVALLTFIFSFLGTLFCSVLTGMMLGAMKSHRWQAIPISLLFPGTMYFMLRGLRVDLPGRQIHLLALLCFGGFWGVYFLAGALVSAEQKARTAAAAAGPQPAPPAPSGAMATGPAAGLTLARLQGVWSWKAAGRDGPVQEKVLEIREDHLALKALDGDGRVCWRAEGSLKVEGAGPQELPLVPAPAGPR